MNERFLFDDKYLGKYDFLIGTDEAGRGPGAGAVFAAAVCFTSLDREYKKPLENLNDSKKLSEKTRIELYNVIINNSIWSIHAGSVEDIEKLNILRTSLLTMKKCVEDVILRLKSKNVMIIIDGNKTIPGLNYNQESIIKGDYKSASIAAASIIAKVERDRYMEKLDKEFPMYDWKVNKGYLTPKHFAAVDEYGLTKYHRKSFFIKHYNKSMQLSLMEYNVP